MKTKNLLIVLGLCFSSLCANADAQPAASKIDWTSPTAQQYSLAFDVIDVKVLTSGKSGYSVTVSTVISEGHLNSTRLLLKVVNVVDNEESSFDVDSTLIAVGSPILKWENAANSSAGLYLTVKGMLPTAKSSRDRAARRTLEIKLTDATGYIYDIPKLNLY